MNYTWKNSLFLIGKRMESREAALTRAKREGIPASQVIEATGGGWFIAPPGIKSHKAKKAYADIRKKQNAESPELKTKAAKIAWSIEKGTL